MSLWAPPLKALLIPSAPPNTVSLLIKGCQGLKVEVMRSRGRVRQIERIGEVSWTSTTEPSVYSSSPNEPHLSVQAAGSRATCNNGETCRRRVSVFVQLLSLWPASCSFRGPPLQTHHLSYDLGGDLLLYVSPPPWTFHFGHTLAFSPLRSWPLSIPFLLPTPLLLLFSPWTQGLRACHSSRSRPLSMFTLLVCGKSMGVLVLCDSAHQSQG